MYRVFCSPGFCANGWEEFIHKRALSDEIVYTIRRNGGVSFQLNSFYCEYLFLFVNRIKNEKKQLLADDNNYFRLFIEKREHHKT